MSFTVQKISAALLAVTVGFHASAELVHSDWQYENDRKVMLDTDTGIEWLKLTNTLNQTDASIVAQMGSGGLYEGWRAATEEELGALMLTFYPHLSTNNNWYNWYSGTRSADVDGYNAGVQWLAMMGQTGYEADRQPNYTTTYYESIGRQLTDGANPGYYGAIRRHNSYDNTSSMTIYKHYYTHPGTGRTNPPYGVFLVSDGGATYSSQANPSMNANNPNAPVNVTSPAVSFGLLLLAIGGVSMRRRRA